MKTYLVTYYFTNGEVHAVRYESQHEFSDDFILSIDKFLISNGHEIVNLNNVCRFTIDEIESEEK